jgi:quinol monooxygenase YgiN
MTFIQTITLVTDQIEAVEILLDEWIAASAQRRTAQRATLAADRDNTNTFVQIVEFPSHEAAMENSRLAETGAFAERLTTLCSAPPTFHNLDVRRVDDWA